MSPTVESESSSLSASVDSTLASNVSLGSPVAVDFQDWGYKRATRADFAVRHLNLHVNPGEHVLLLGASGIGKSTLLEGAAGLLGVSEESADEDGGVSEGRLLIDGAEAVSQRGRCALMLQDPDSQAVLQRVGDNVAFGLENLGVPQSDIWPIVRTSLEAVGLGDVELHRSTSHLSGGQMQRLALAGALAMKPGVLLLDEPTANLDPDGAAQVVKAVHGVLAESASTVIMVEHRAQLWLDLIDRVVILGRADDTDSVAILADDEPAVVFNRTDLDFDALGIWVPTKYSASRKQRESARSLLAGEQQRSGRVQGDSLLYAVGLSIGRKSVIASDINVEFHAGEITALVGTNGAGKSTLALSLAGLLKPLAGSVVASDVLRESTNGLLDADPQKWSSSHLAHRISYVFQNPEHQFARSSVLDEVMLGLTVGGVEEHEAEAQAHDLLARFGLDRYARANPYTLSGGEKRRLTVAAALACAPKVVILDEPTFGQDRRTWLEMVRLIADLVRTEVSIIVVTHDEELVEVLNARVIRLGEADGSSPTESSDCASVPAPKEYVRVTPIVERTEPVKPASRSRVIATLNPSMRMIGAFLATIPMLFSLDLASAGISLALEFILFAISGISPCRVVRSAWPVFIGAPGSALAVFLYGKAGGAVLWSFGMIHVTERSLMLGGATALRVLAIGIPAIVLILGVDSTDLADSFSQVLHLPDRFVYGGLAGMRLFTVIQEDWSALSASRRSRGLGDGSKVRAFFPQVFALLVLSIRRSTSLATAMEARGFGGITPRTHARLSSVHARDMVFLGICLAIPVVALIASWNLGYFAFMGDTAIT